MESAPLGARVVDPPIQVTRRSVGLSRQKGVRSGRLATAALVTFQRHAARSRRWNVTSATATATAVRATSTPA
jgi:hypothetical protein